MNKILNAALVLMVLLVASSFPTRAHAGWTNLALVNGAEQYYSGARACKTYVPSDYGRLWKVTFHVFRKVAWPGQFISTYSQRPPTNNGYYTDNNQWLAGVVAGIDFYASIDLNDTVRLAVSAPDGSGWSLRANRYTSFDINPATLATC